VDVLDDQSLVDEMLLQMEVYVERRPKWMRAIKGAVQLRSLVVVVSVIMVGMALLLNGRERCLKGVCRILHFVSEWVSSSKLCPNVPQTTSLQRNHLQ